MIVGVLVLVVSIGFALYTVCATPTTCTTQLDWATLSPSLLLLVMGAAMFVLARRQARQAR